MRNLQTITAGPCVFLFLSLFSFVASGQDSSSAARSPATSRQPIDKSKIPKAVTEEFYKQYPVKTSTDWYAYPSYDDGDDWYEFDPSYHSNQDPENYVVVFRHKRILTKAIYSKDGKKIAVHQDMNAPLPASVTRSIREGLYKSWILTKDREQIFKDSKSDKIIVYRVVVKKDNEKHVLYFQQNGKLLKVRQTA
jgi:hypothetical protein